MSDSYIWTLDKHKHNTLRKTKYEIIVNTLDCKKLNDTIPSLAKKKPEFNGLMRPFNICVSRIHQTFAKLIQPSWNLDGKLDQQLAVRLFFFFFRRQTFLFAPEYFFSDVSFAFAFRFPFFSFFLLVGITPCSYTLQSLTYCNPIRSLWKTKTKQRTPKSKLHHTTLKCFFSFPFSFGFLLLFGSLAQKFHLLLRKAGIYCLLFWNLWGTKMMV